MNNQIIYLENVVGFALVCSKNMKITAIEREAVKYMSENL